MPNCSKCLKKLGVDRIGQLCKKCGLERHADVIKEKKIYEKEHGSNKDKQ